MVCKACGAEIAEKALICYKCGAATFEAVRKPAPLPAARPHLGVLAWAMAISAVALVGSGPVGLDVFDASVAYTGAGLLAGASLWSAMRAR